MNNIYIYIRFSSMNLSYMSNNLDELIEQIKNSYHNSVFADIHRFKGIVEWVRIYHTPNKKIYLLNGKQYHSLYKTLKSPALKFVSCDLDKMTVTFP